jgi:hypothetical protein
MILKQKDDVAPYLEQLEQLRRNWSLTKTQREEIEEEIWMIRAGAKGEKEAAYTSTSIGRMESTASLSMICASSIRVESPRSIT